MLRVWLWRGRGPPSILVLAAHFLERMRRQRPLDVNCRLGLHRRSRYFWRYVLECAEDKIGSLVWIDAQISKGPLSNAIYGFLHIGSSSPGTEYKLSSVRLSSVTVDDALAVYRSLRFGVSPPPTKSP
jgi:hypothetical protein